MHDEFVPETEIDDAEVFRRGGADGGDEDFAIFKCPTCNRIYLINYEVDTLFLDSEDLSKRIFADSFTCIECGRDFANDEPIIGPKANQKFKVCWQELSHSPWRWITSRTRQ